MEARKKRFVIYEPTVLVALDLEQSLREHDEEADVLLVATLADAIDLMVAGDVSLAVLHAGAEHIPRNTTVPALLIGDAAEDGGGPWPVLRRPFCSQDVEAALRTLGVGRRRVWG